LLHKERKDIKPKDGENPRNWFEESEQLRKIANAQPPPHSSVAYGSVDRYKDPVDNKTYVGGYSWAQINGQKVVVLVQHEEQTDLKPLADFKGAMVRFGWISFAVVSVTMWGLFYWLFWILRRQEQVTHG
jgi:hypothetical protein